MAKPPNSDTLITMRASTAQAQQICKPVRLVYPLFSTLWPYWAQKLCHWPFEFFCILINFYPAEPLELLLTVLTLVFLRRNAVLL